MWIPKRRNPWTLLHTNNCRGRAVEQVCIVTCLEGGLGWLSWVKGGVTCLEGALTHLESRLAHVETGLAHSLTAMTALHACLADAQLVQPSLGS